MSALQQTNSFSAHLALAAGVSVSINAGSLDELAGVVAKLQGKAPANEVAWPANAEQEAARVAAARTKEQPGGKPTASASTSTQASAPAADSGSAGAAGDAQRFTYDDVKAKVLALSKVRRELAVETLGKFQTVKGEKVDHGNKLQLEDYAAFIAAADAALKV